MSSAIKKVFLLNFEACKPTEPWRLYRCFGVFLSCKCDLLSRMCNLLNLEDRKSQDNSWHSRDSEQAAVALRLKLLLP